MVQMLAHDDEIACNGQERTSLVPELGDNQKPSTKSSSSVSSLSFSISRILGDKLYQKSASSTSSGKNSEPVVTILPPNPSICIPQQTTVIDSYCRTDLGSPILVPRTTLAAPIDAPLCSSSPKPASQSACVLNNNELFNSSSGSPVWISELQRRRLLPDHRQSGRRVGHPYQARAPAKHKKPRTSFTKNQITELEKRFGDQKYLASTERASLAKSLKMSDGQVKTWFQNRRTKWRRQAAEEREQERQATCRYLSSLGNFELAGAPYSSQPSSLFIRPDVTI